MNEGETLKRLNTINPKVQLGTGRGRKRRSGKTEDYIANIEQGEKIRFSRYL